jgi:hypothetical protein
MPDHRTDRYSGARRAAPGQARRIMTRFGFAEVVVSEHDILDGIATSLVP